uniref:Uncharacterized protein n=1 Tax=Megaselia scalaris TaxID=36166 RepID=T1GVD1_MEGSC
MESLASKTIIEICKISLAPKHTSLQIRDGHLLGFKDGWEMSVIYVIYKRNLYMNYPNDAESYLELLEMIMKTTEIETKNMITNKSTQILGYADDIDVAGRTTSDLFRFALKKQFLLCSLQKVGTHFSPNNSCSATSYSKHASHPPFKATKIGGSVGKDERSSCMKSMISQLPTARIA